MSRLDDLLKELCPDGVEYIPLDTLFETRNGYTPSKNNDDFWTDGTVPWFRLEDIREKGNILSVASQYVSSKAVKGKLFPEDSIIVATSATIGVHALVKVPSLANQRFTYLVVRNNYKDLYDIKFLYYYCYKLDEYCKANLNQGNFASVDMKRFKNFMFPVPPLEVQREIVRVLDSFTLLLDELTDKLTDDLTARKKQYKYYLNQFFEKQNDNLVALEDIGTLTRGKRFVHADATDTGVPCIHYGELYTYYGIYANNVKSHIREELRSKMRYAHKGDVIIVGAGENNVDIGVGVAWEGDEDVAVHDACYTLVHNQNSKYISYYLRSDMYHSQIKKYVSEGKICSISAAGLGKARIPIPSMGEQQHIVDILDRFDALCNDISEGLPSEIEARRKQYEHYRDKLLSFKELV